MEILKVAPVFHNFNILHLGIRQFAASVLCAVPKADIDTVVVLGFLFFLPCFKALYGVGLHKRISAFVLPGAVVLVVAGEREEPVPVEFVQEKYIESEAGDNTYYQWGRKDAMPGGIYNKDVPDIWPADQGRCDMQNKRFFNEAYNFGVDEGRATLGKSIQTPYIQYSSPNRIVRKNNAPYPNNYYDNRIFWLWDHRDNNGIPQPFSATMTTHPLLYNLWNGLRTEPFNDEVVPGSSATDEQKAAWTAAETTFSKTIYDPCPTGFHIPNNHILSHFFKEGTGGGPDSATWDNYVSVMIDDEGGGETIGEKFKDSAGNTIIFYFVGLRDHRYPPNERPARVTGRGRWRSRLVCRWGRRRR